MCHPFSFIAFLSKGNKLVVLPHADDDPSSKENSNANSHTQIFDSHGFDETNYPDGMFEQIFARVELLNPARSENSGIAKGKVGQPDTWEFCVDSPVPAWLTAPLRKTLEKETRALAKKILKDNYSPPGMTKLKPTGSIPVTIGYTEEEYSEGSEYFNAFTLKDENGSELFADSDLVAAAKKKVLLRVLEVPIIDGVVEYWAEKGNEKKVVRPDTAFEAPDDFETILKI